MMLERRGKPVKRLDRTRGGYKSRVEAIPEVSTVG
jgi:hypothetical protein